MVLNIIDWLIIVVYVIVSILIALKYRDRAGKSISEFFLGGRNIPWHIAGISMVATTFAADTPLAVTELVVKNGISGNWLWWNMLIGGMLTTFFFAKLWRRANVLTELEFIELRYSGKPAAFLRGFKAVYLGLFMNILIIGWVNLALMSLLKIFFDIPDDMLIWYTLAAMFIVAVYSSISGLLGVAVTDVIQFVIAMTGCIILAIVVVNSDEVGGITELKEKLPDWSLSFFPRIGNNISDTVSTLTISVGSFLAFGLVQWWASWYPGAEPGGGGYIAQRMMSTKNEKHSIYATLLFQISHYALRPWPWIIVALSTIVLYPDLPEGQEKLGYVMAMKDFLPAGLKGLLLVAFLAAYMSTISTQLNWGASYLTNDLYKRFIRKEGSFKNEKIEQKNYVLAGRIFTFITMLLSIIATSQMNSISGVWTFIIECGAGLGLVLILRWYWWRINAWSEIAATFTPFVVFAFTKFIFHLEFPDSFFITVAVTTFTWLIVTYLSPVTEKVTLQNFCDRVQPKGFWKGAPVAYSKQVDNTGVGLHFVNWFAAIILTYSSLFFIGKLIFLEWTSALIWLISIVISTFVLIKTIRT